MQELDRIISQYIQVLGSSAETAGLVIEPLADRATIAIGKAQGVNDTSDKIQTIYELADQLREKIR